MLRKLAKLDDGPYLVFALALGLITATAAIAHLVGLAAGGWFFIAVAALAAIDALHSWLAPSAKLPTRGRKR